jgi:hypothetical protein
MRLIGTTLGSQVNRDVEYQLWLAASRKAANVPAVHAIYSFYVTNGALASPAIKGLGNLVARMTASMESRRRLPRLVLHDCPYGWCEYRCGNDVMDYQVVSSLPTVSMRQHGGQRVYSRRAVDLAGGVKRESLDGIRGGSVAIERAERSALRAGVGSLAIACVGGKHGMLSAAITREEFGQCLFGSSRYE